MKNGIISNEIQEDIRSIVESKNLELYYIEYVKESGENYLRIYIDSSDGISLDDCESVSRPISDLLDEKDPIDEGYYLEVSSPGIYRTLYTDKHMKDNINKSVLVKLNSLLNGKKKYEGILKNFSNDFVTIEIEGSEISVERNKIVSVSLKGDL